MKYNITFLALDSEGERTIGVLTKVDIMDHGTDCCDILNNKIIPLRKGYVAVMNRYQLSAPLSYSINTISFAFG